MIYIEPKMEMIVFDAGIATGDPVGTSKGNISDDQGTF